MTNNKNKSKIVNMEEYILGLFMVDILSVPEAKNEAKYKKAGLTPSTYNYNNNILYDNHIIKEKMNEFKNSLKTFNEYLYFNWKVKYAMNCGKKSIKIKLIFPFNNLHILHTMIEKIKDKGYIINELNTEDTCNEIYSIWYLVHWD
uniref:Uncharacterized protein n=1 Tax=Mimivirus LCMiAC02 TaxID=2506609 RepID=A0A4P6VQP8_9VIRU|nr:MAG: hypothetical protein LCMiAC02_04900 [Mimivirus LCMiAC02]